MKYRTVIELVCSASDRDEACNIAGEYLKGDLDFGVEMKFKTASCFAHKALKYGITCAAVFMVSFTFLALFEPIANMGEKSKSTIIAGISSICTVTPELKTQGETRFKEKWAWKKDKTVLDYLRN